MKIREIMEAGFFWSEPFKIASDSEPTGDKPLPRRLKPHLWKTDIPQSRNRRCRPDALVQAIKRFKQGKVTEPA